MIAIHEFSGRNLLSIRLLIRSNSEYYAFSDGIYRIVSKHFLDYVVHTLFELIRSEK